MGFCNCSFFGLLWTWKTIQDTAIKRMPEFQKPIRPGLSTERASLINQRLDAINQA
jgi:hypothetical protein